MNSYKLVRLIIRILIFVSSDVARLIRHILTSGSSPSPPFLVEPLLVTAGVTLGVRESIHRAVFHYALRRYATPGKKNP